MFRCTNIVSFEIIEMILFKLWSSNDQIIVEIWIVFEWRMEERIFNDFDTTRKLSFSTHVLFLRREFNLHARSRASNIHPLLKGIKNKGKEQKKTRIKSTNVFYPRSNETGANFQLDFLFRFEYKSPRICSPLFRLLLLYVAPRGEKYSTRKRYCHSPRKWSRQRIRFHWFIPSSDHPFSFRIIEYHVP